MALRRIAMLVLVALALLGHRSPVAAADMFGRAESPAAAEVATPRPMPDAKPLLPEPVRQALGQALAIQNRLNAELRGQLQLARQGLSWRPAMAIILISFLYGVLHAVGPGHGKVVVGSYFVSRRARILHGLAMSGSAAFTQSLSAVALVTVLATVLQVGSREILAHAGTLETVSYGAITALGLWMAWGALRGGACCAHAGEAGHSHDQGEPGHSHDCGDHGHHGNHGHGAACGHDHSHQPPRHGGRSELARVLATGAAVGLRPCSGAIMVLLFTLANQIYPIGIAATFAMGLGVAVTVAAVSLATLGVHRSLSTLGERRAQTAERLHRLASFAGALVICLFGGLQLLGIWTGAIVPMAG